MAKKRQSMTEKELEHFLAIAEHARQDAIDRPITHEEFYYLLSKYPYLEICDAKLTDIEPSNPLMKRKAKTGWIIHDYGNILRVAQSELASLLQYGINPSATPGLLSGKPTEEGGEGGEGGETGKGGEGGEGDEGLGELKPLGTIVAQFVKTAEELIGIAQSRWDGAQIIGGFYGMQRAAWVMAEIEEYELKGFDPTAEDKVVYYWVKQLLKKKKKGLATERAAKPGLPGTGEE